jgi:hypothetical protein
LDHEGNVND